MRSRYFFELQGLELHKLYSINLVLSALIIYEIESKACTHIPLCAIVRPPCVTVGHKILIKFDVQPWESHYQNVLKSWAGWQSQSKRFKRLAGTVNRKE